MHIEFAQSGLHTFNLSPPPPSKKKKEKRENQEGIYLILETRKWTICNISSIILYISSPF